METLKKTYPPLFQPHEVPDKFKSWRGRDTGSSKGSPAASRDQTPETKEECRGRKARPQGRQVPTREVHKVRLTYYSRRVSKPKPKP